MSMRSGVEEVFLALPSPRDRLAPTTSFRSTWLVSSLETLRAHDLVERYFELLPAEHEPAMRSIIAGAWVPIDLAIAHYETCDRLGLTPGEQLRIAREVTGRSQSTVLSFATSLARGVGATPWTALGHFQRLWDRMFEGGGVAVYKLGPKEVRIEMLGCRLAHVQYFRAGLRGVVLGVGELFARTIYVTEVPTPKEPTSIVFRGSWV
jgi:hypothetical protein